MQVTIVTSTATARAISVRRSIMREPAQSALSAIPGACATLLRRAPWRLNQSHDPCPPDARARAGSECATHLQLYDHARRPVRRRDRRRWRYRQGEKTTRPLHSLSLETFDSTTEALC